MEQTIIDLYSKDFSSRKIAAELHISKTKVLRVLKKNNIPTNRGRSYYTSKKTKQEEQIIELYNKGYSFSQVGILVGKSKSGVRGTLRKFNINTNRTLGNYDSRKYKIDDDYFECIDTPNKAYILGFIMADGCVMQERNTVTITIHRDDVEILEFIRKEFNTEYPLRVLKEKYLTLSIISKKMVSDLVSLGIVSRKTKVLKLPTIPKPLYPDLFRGYFDGDGSIWFDKQAKAYRIQILGTTDVLNGFKNVLGLRDNKLRAANKDNTVFRLGYSGNVNVSNILSSVYFEDRFCLKRKFLKYQECVAIRKKQ